MVSTETVAFIAKPYKKVAAFVPDSLEKKWSERRAGAVVPVCTAAVWAICGSTEARASCWCVFVTIDTFDDQTAYFLPGLVNAHGLNVVALFVD